MRHAMRHAMVLSLAGALAACASARKDTPKPETGSEPSSEASSTEASKTGASGSAAEALPVSTNLAEVGLDKSAIDPNVNPCEDFYRYACGAWIDRTVIPSDQPRWVRSFNEIQKENEAFLKTLFEEEAKKKSQLGRFYASCMDEKAVEKAGKTPLQAWFKQLDQLKKPAQLTEVIAKLHQARIWAFFDVESIQDFKKATDMIGGLDQSGLGLPDRDYYLKEDPDSVKIRKFYQAHMTQLFQLAGFSKFKARAAMLDAFRIETQLAKRSKTRVERRQPEGMSNKVSLKELKALAPNFGWEAYFKALDLEGLQAINLTSPEYFKTLDQHLQRERMTAIRAYLKWRVIQSLAPWMSSDFVKEDFRMTQRLSGQKEIRARDKRCMALSTYMLPDLVGQLYVAQKFGGDSKAAAEHSIEGIRQAFKQRLGELSWMDAETRAAAEAKLAKVNFLIGYPKKWQNYDFEVGADLTANLLAARAFHLKDDLAQIGKPVDRDRWAMPASMVNAYYSSRKNIMVFPAGILQPPFYSAKSSLAANMGAMGFVVGHELTHGFDDQGSKFDGDGNLKPWWSPKVAPSFKEKTACVSKKYAAYEPVKGVPLNGDLTLGENIADIGGLRLAFEAFKTMREGKPEVIADGYTEAQQFFLASAQIWCAKVSEPYLRLMVANDPHSPPEFRVNGSLSEVQGFAEAFQCPVGSPMNPEKRCSVW